MTHSPNTSLEEILKLSECTGYTCNHETGDTHYLIFDDTIKEIKTLFNNSLKEKMIEAREAECMENYENATRLSCRSCQSFPNVIAKYFNDRLEEFKTTNTNRGASV